MCSSKLLKIIERREQGDLSMLSIFSVSTYDPKLLVKVSLITFILIGISIPINSQAVDKDWNVDGYIENSSYYRFHGIGLSKSRSRLQLELSKEIGDFGIFKNVEFNGTLRGSYDAVYKLNDEEYGRSSGTNVDFSNNAIPNLRTPWGASPVSTGFADFGFDTTNNLNEGLEIVGNRLHGDDGGLRFATPTRPCDIDSRGCIDSYLDADEQELYAPEFNNRVDLIREAYFSGTIPLANNDKINVTFGRQQVVWGRTDLFRVLDVINPVDYSQNNIYDELEDIRIPMGIFTAEYSWGATDNFEDLNLQFLWKWEKFRPHTLGQAGTPNSIIDAGSLFRAYKNCWDNGCTVGNFAVDGSLTTDFPAHSVGIRQADLPDWEIDETDVGMRLEGVYKGVGFSVNGLYYRSQLPSINGGIPAVDPFVPGSPEIPRQFLPAGDIVFPRIGLIGGSADFYVDSWKSAFRVELAWTTGEEFADTTQPNLYAESDVIRWVVGIDRPTFIPL